MKSLPFSASFPAENLYGFPLAASTPVPLQLATLSRVVGDADQDSRWNQAPTSLYVHVPFCLTLCQFCGFIKSPLKNRERLHTYVDDIITEICRMAANIAPGQKISSIYFGGGTPSVLGLEQVRQILNCASEQFTLSDGCEFSFEGEGSTLSDMEYLHGLSALGFQRISFGVQTMDLDARRVLNLKPTIEQLSFISETGRALFSDVNVDFIFGWPGQSTSHANEDLIELIAKIQPTSIEVFQFEALDASPTFLSHLRHGGVLMPSTEEVQDQYRVLCETLKSFGFERLGYTKFSRRKSGRTWLYDECYYGWDNGQVLGVGRGSQSFYKGVMWGSGLSESEFKNELDCGNLPANVLAKFDYGEREIVTWPRRGNIKFTSLAYSEDSLFKLQTLEKAGLVEQFNVQYQLTSLGIDWVPSIIQYMLSDSDRATVESITAQRVSQRSILETSIPIFDAAKI